jgi:hypothetical protein
METEPAMDTDQPSPLLRHQLRKPRARRAMVGLVFVVGVFVIVPVVAMLLAGS